MPGRLPGLISCLALTTCGPGDGAGSLFLSDKPLCSPSVSAELPSSEHLSVADATWLALNVVSGGGGFSGSQPIGVTKIAKSVIAPLADQNISVFMLSTYQTDFILVRDIAGPARVTCQQMALNDASVTLGRSSCLRSSRITKVCFPQSSVPLGGYVADTHIYILLMIDNLTDVCSNSSESASLDIHLVHLLLHMGIMCPLPCARNLHCSIFILLVHHHSGHHQLTLSSPPGT